MKALPYRIFESRIDKILRRVPSIGKLLSGLFGLFENLFLELIRKIDVSFGIYTMGIVNRYILKGRWGGKVIPLNKNIYFDTKFIASQEVLKVLERSKVTGISDCYCRSTQRKFSVPNCDHPLSTCIHIGFGKSLYEIPYKSYNLKKVSKREIVELLEDSDRRGLIHQLIYFPNPQFYYIICNCCSCCCVILNQFLKNGSPQMIKSDFIAKTDMVKCKSCGKCVSWCSFNARVIRPKNLIFKPIRCFGCGVCISKCPNDAITLISKGISSPNYQY